MKRYKSLSLVLIVILVSMLIGCTGTTVTNTVTQTQNQTLTETQTQTVTETQIQTKTDIVTETLTTKITEPPRTITEYPTTTNITTQPPAITSPPSLNVLSQEVDGLTIDVDGEAIPNSTDSTITRIHWDWGDGMTEDHPFPASHNYIAYSDYTVTVTAYQSDNLTDTAIFSTGSLEIETYPDDARVVALLIDPLLLDGIRLKLTQFEEDLDNDGYIVIERSDDYNNPPEVRALLGELLAQTEQHLVGSILIGDLPHAYQWVTLHSSNPNIPDTNEEVISFQYYQDLDGTFTTSPDYTSQGGYQYSYDIHNGNTDWEIWIGALPYYKGNLDESITAINRYFTKNHSYRIGEYNIPRCFLQINEHHKADTLEEYNDILKSMRSGTYSWTPFSDAPDARLYFDSPPGGVSVDRGYADLHEELADFTVLDAHGYWGASGKLTIALVEDEPLKTVFLWSNGCAVGNLDRPETFLTSVLYSPTSMVLIAKGTTNNAGGMGTNENGFFGHNIATALSNGESFGQAIRYHVNVPLISPWANSREFQFATTIVLGDPTLKLSTYQ